MIRPLKIVLRFAAALAFATALLIVFSTSAPGRSPYLSALDNLASTAQAATHCANKACASVSGGCVQSNGTFCAKSGGQCFTRGC